MMSEGKGSFREDGDGDGDGTGECAWGGLYSFQYLLLR